MYQCFWPCGWVPGLVTEWSLAHRQWRPQSLGLFSNFAIMRCICTLMFGVMHAHVSPKSNRLVLAKPHLQCKATQTKGFRLGVHALLLFWPDKLRGCNHRHQHNCWLLATHNSSQPRGRGNGKGPEGGIKAHAGASCATYAVIDSQLYWSVTGKGKLHEGE